MIQVLVTATVILMDYFLLFIRHLASHPPPSQGFTRESTCICFLTDKSQAPQTYSRHVVGPPKYLFNEQMNLHS